MGSNQFLQGTFRHKSDPLGGSPLACAGPVKALLSPIHWTQTYHPQCALKASSGQNKPLMMLAVAFDRA